MLTTMVAGPGPAYCENGGRNGHLEVVNPPQFNGSSGGGRIQLRPPSPNSIFIPNNVITTTSSISNSINSSITTTSPSIPRSDSCLNGSNNIVAVVQTEVCSGVPQQQYTPPPLHAPLTQQQGPPPPYCSQDYVSGDIYYSAPHEYAHHSICTMHHGVPGDYSLSPGPATVRMVSTNSSPPIPLPVQMPPGHVVQQIVDETGTLQHVILSAQPMSLPVCSYGPNTGQGPPQYYSPPPQQGPPPPQGWTSYPPAQYSPVMSPPLTQPSPPPHNYQKNDRNSRQHEKIRNKFYQQRHS